jgi:cytochrome c nitrite reductase small subunit
MKLPFIVGVIACCGLAGMYVTNFTGLGSDLQTCNNCHAMDTEYQGWYSAVTDRAECSDCHTPYAFIPALI